MKTNIKFLGALILCMWIMQPAFAQTSNQGGIAGRVTDPNGSSVPAVEILVTNLDTAQSRTVVSTQSGDYRLDFLTPGRYKILATRAGFTRVEIPEVTVHVSEVQRVDISLQVGSVNEEVSISTGGEVQINTETPTLGEVVNERSIQNLPLNGREFLELAGLVPGAETGNDKRGAVANRGVSVGFGNRAGYNAYYVDGADSTDPNENQLISSPALDAIKEFRVETSLYSARYGRAGGGVVNIVTKSGTNAFHGTVYEYHRNKKFDAIPFGYIGTREDQPNYRFNQFGGTVGGPVMLPRFGLGGKSYWSGKNKTFFFFSAEYFRQIKPGTVQESFAPTAKERIGDFTESINPYSNTKVVLRNPFTGAIIPSNIIPPELINPVGKKLMDLWAAPNYAGNPILNLHVLRSGVYNQNKYLLKLDHSFSSKSSLSGSFNYGKYDNITPGIIALSDSTSVNYDKSLVVTYTRTISSNLVNDFKFNYTTYTSGGRLASFDKNYAAELGFWTGLQKPDAKGVPRILFYTVGNRIYQIGGPGPNLRDTRNLYLKDDLVWVKGTHSISMGGDFKRQKVDWLISNAPLGNYYFGLNDGLASQNATYQVAGSTFADVLMGVTARTIFDTNDGRATKSKRNQLGLYIQDDWKVTPRLTLNLGLRYDFEEPFTSTDHQFMTLNFKTGLPWYAEGAPAEKLATLQFPYETGGPNRPYDPQLFNFAPRVGFAFRPFNDNKTAIRGGYGMVYNSETFYTTAYGSFVVPFSGQFDYFAKYNATTAPWPDRLAHFVTVDKEPYRLDLIAGKSPGTFIPPTPYYPSGNIQHWNLAVSREIPWGIAVEAAYVGSKGTNLNGGSTLAAEDPAANALVRSKIPGWAAIGVRTKGFNSNYHALQTKANKRLAAGLSFLASFTWSHALAEASNDAINENNFLDPTTQYVSRRWSNADYDVRKRFTLSGSYDLPFGHGRRFGANWNRVVDALAGGLRTNLILTLQDGRPYSVRTAAGGVPNRICDGNLPSSERTDQRWYDHTCFPAAAVGQGNAGTNHIIGPGIKNVDASLHKEFRFTETAKVQLRFETFNLFNVVNLIGPSTNFFVNTAAGTSITRARDRRDIQLAIKFLF